MQNSREKSTPLDFFFYLQLPTLKRSPMGPIRKCSNGSDTEMQTSNVIIYSSFSLLILDAPLY